MTAPLPAVDVDVDGASMQELCLGDTLGNWDVLLTVPFEPDDPKVGPP